MGALAAGEAVEDVLDVAETVVAGVVLDVLVVLVDAAHHVLLHVLGVKADAEHLVHRLVPDVQVVETHVQVVVVVDPVPVVVLQVVKGAVVIADPGAVVVVAVALEVADLGVRADVPGVLHRVVDARGAVKAALVVVADQLVLLVVIHHALVAVALVVQAAVVVDVQDHVVRIVLVDVGQHVKVVKGALDVVAVDPVVMDALDALKDV